MGVVGKTLNYLALRFGLCVVVRACGCACVCPPIHTYIHALHTYTQVVNGVVADRGPAHERASTGGAGGGSGGGSSGGGGGMHAMWGFKPALGEHSANGGTVV